MHLRIIVGLSITYQKGLGVPYVLVLIKSSSRNMFQNYLRCEPNESGVLVADAGIHGLQIAQGAIISPKTTESIGIPWKHI